MNIVINGKCTKNCSFCFESDEFKSNTEDMTIEEFENIIDFAIKNNNGNTIEISLLGGEPAIHPNFIQMLELMIYKESQMPLEKHFDLGIITNGDLLGTYINILYKFRYRVSFLLNTSSMLWNRKEIVDKINKLSKFQKNGNIDFGLAFTITNFSIKEDLEFLLNKYNKEEIYHYRIAFASDHLASNFNYYLENKKYILEAYDLISKKGRVIGMDCSRIPTCAFTKEEFYKLKSYNIVQVSGDDNYLYGICINNADILPNGEIIHCMPLREYRVENKKYNDFNNIEDIYKYTYSIKLDAAKNKLDKSSICYECPLYKLNKCFAGCLGMNLLPTDEKIKEQFEWIAELENFKD